MGTILTCFFIAVSLSMDAFSLSLIYGTYGFEKKKEILLAIMVGIFHFFMPLLGLGFGSILVKYFIFNLNYMVGIIFMIIGIEMIFSSRNKDDINLRPGIGGFLLFGLSVSVDSFTTGIGLSAISHNYIGIAFMFMIVSGIFTYLGLIFGNSLSNSFGKYATIIGGIFMCLISLYQIFSL